MTTTTFNILVWIRARRLKWVGHILRLKKRRGEERLIKKTLKVIYDHRQDGDILMDVSEKNWDVMFHVAANKNARSQRVKMLKIQSQRTTKPLKVTHNNPRAHSTCTIHIYTNKSERQRQRQK